MQKPRGTRDLWGEELSRVRKVQKNLKKIFNRYGYEEIETPIFEKLELFTEKSGSEIIDQIYHFEDKSERQLALRPELTAPSIRLYNNDLKRKPKPMKMFYFGPCFRYERPQAGRWRQFLQAGVELIGTDRPEADAEVISLTSDTLHAMGIEDYSLRVGHIGLLRTLLEFGGVSREDQDPVLRAIDSDDEERLEESLNENVSEDVKDRILDLIDISGSSEEVIDEAAELFEGVPKSEDILENFEKILERLRFMNVEDYEIDFGVARGLEYYTGSVFEVYFDDIQIGGGGRYDGLIESLGGESEPAVGVGFGVDRLAKILEELEKDGNGTDLDAMLLPTEDSMLEESLCLARSLRKKGFEIDIDLMGRSLGKAMSYADSRNAKRAIIIGPDDLEEGRVTMKNMETGKQERVFREAVSKRLSSIS